MKSETVMMKRRRISWSAPLDDEEEDHLAEVAEKMMTTPKGKEVGPVGKYQLKEWTELGQDWLLVLFFSDDTCGIRDLAFCKCCK